MDTNKLERVFVNSMGIFIILAVAFILMRNPGEKSPVATAAPVSEKRISASLDAFHAKSTGSVNSGDVLIELTPKIEDGEKIIISFLVNPPSISLDEFNLKEMSTLEYEGEIVKPLRASRVSGHHSSGEIVFAVTKEISSFKIIIKDIPKVQERVYEWND
jgi:hypothetical protein